MQQMSNNLSTRGLKIRIGARGNFHSHPNGIIKEPFGKKFRFYYFIQGPSYQDQKMIRDKIGYVFAMRDSCQRIYIYDSTGVLATLPFEY